MDIVFSQNSFIIILMIVSLLLYGTELQFSNVGERVKSSQCNHVLHLGALLHFSKYFINDLGFVIRVQEKIITR